MERRLTLDERWPAHFAMLRVFVREGAKYVWDVVQAPLLAAGSRRERATAVSRAWLANVPYGTVAIEWVRHGAGGGGGSAMGNT